MPSERDSLLAYFRRQRERSISAYRAATFWVQRQDARRWALHYGRLIRMLENKA